MLLCDNTALFCWQRPQIRLIGSTGWDAYWGERGCLRHVESCEGCSEATAQCWSGCCENLEPTAICRKPRGPETPGISVLALPRTCRGAKCGGGWTRCHVSTHAGCAQASRVAGEGYGELESRHLATSPRHTYTGVQFQQSVNTIQLIHQFTPNVTHTHYVKFCWKDQSVPRTCPSVLKIDSLSALFRVLR